MLQGQQYIFLLILNDAPIPTITIKLLFDQGRELQNEYNIVIQSYLNLQNCIDVDIDNNFHVSQLEEWIIESYGLVMAETKTSEKGGHVSLAKLFGIKGKEC